MTQGPSDVATEERQAGDAAPPGARDASVDRKPWVAVALTLLTIGLGHLYVGRPARAAIVWMLSSVGFIAFVALAVTLPGAAQLVAFAAALVASYALPAADAARIARSIGHVFRPRWYNRWYLYAVLVVLGAFTWQPWSRGWTIANVAEAFTIPGNAMSPAVMAGDYIFATPTRGDFARGDVVAFRNAGALQVSRLVGLPGDTIEMRSGAVSVRGLVLAEPYASSDTSDASYPQLAWQSAHLTSIVDRARYRPSMMTWGPLVVPAGAYFLLGDNRGESLDSRLVGFVARAAIVKRPTVIYFSRDPETGDVRWSRIGRDLRR